MGKRVTADNAPGCLQASTQDSTLYYGYFGVLAARRIKVAKAVWVPSAEQAMVRGKGFLVNHNHDDGNLAGN